MSRTEQKNQTKLSSEIERVAKKFGLKETSLCQQVFKNHRKHSAACNREIQAQEDLEALLAFEESRDRRREAAE